MYGFIPDFSSRFYTEDIPNGVCIIKALSQFVGVETPTIDYVLDWYFRMTGKEYFQKDGSFGKGNSYSTDQWNSNSRRFGGFLYKVISGSLQKFRTI